MLAKLLATGAVLLAAAAPASAQDTWLRDGQAYRGPDAAASGDFAVLQVLTTEPEQLMADWEKPGAVVHLVAKDAVGRGKPVVSFIVFRGCRADAKGACHVTADFVATDPAGKTYGEFKDVEIWVDKPPPPGRAVQLSAGGMGLVFEPKDLAGRYRIAARVVDHVAGVTLQTEKTLTLVSN